MLQLTHSHSGTQLNVVVVSSSSVVSAINYYDGLEVVVDKMRSALRPGLTPGLISGLSEMYQRREAAHFWRKLPGRKLDHKCSPDQTPPL
ncbi:unnamed protein product [Nippostrongylus brasiliensis]|uniref:KR domain-containing protein n=1 Tax=Nippostrongylus brasiliensis TaxID=27835 RepID=A0A0N4YG14_NIPBR|nr:unnamed protein product [Nippostrongylus brasiliensis]